MTKNISKNTQEPSNESFFNKFKKNKSNKIENFVDFIENDFEKNIKFLKCNEFKETFVLEFKPTNYCNLSCEYCCFHSKEKNSFDINQTEKLLKIVKYLMDKINYKKIYLFIYGGEPTLYPHLNKFIKTSIDYFEKNNFEYKILIQSNGFSSIEKIIDPKIYKNLSFSLSFHYKELLKHRKIKKFIKNAELLNSIGLLQEITYMITKDNLKNDLALINLFKQKKLPLYIRSILQESNYFRKKYDGLLTIEDKNYETDQGNFSFEDLTVNNSFNFQNYYCEAGITSCIVSENDLYRCDMDFLYDINKIGTIQEDYSILIKKFNKLYNDKCNLKCSHKFCSIYFSNKFHENYSKELINGKDI